MESTKIIQENADEHVFVVVECKDRPTVSIDIVNLHGRRFLGVRIDGFGVCDCLVDLQSLPPNHYSEKMFRYCQFCGEKLSVFSSRGHQCA